MTPSITRAEKPLQGWGKFGVELAAAGAILLFYTYAAVMALLLSLLLLGEVILAIGMARFGLTRLLVGPIQRHTQLLVLFLRSAWIRDRRSLQVPLERRDAPALFAFLDRLSRHLKVAPPRQVLIEMNAGAWVRLNGLRRGANATTLGLGYDLIAGLSEREVEAVLAHEMAHAKFVRRGLKHILNGGMARAANLANNLGALVEGYRRARKPFEFAESLLRGARRFALSAARLVAAYSRQDEFEADRGAAALVGPAPIRSSLVKLEAIFAKTARISWSERVAQLQAGHFREWLTAELNVVTEATATAAAATYNPYATHPSLHDRLAALPPGPADVIVDKPAIGLFTDPNAVANRLVAAIQRFAAEEEQRDSRERRKWLRKLRRGVAVRPLQLLGGLVVVVGAIIAAFAWAAGFNPVPLLVGAATMVAGAVLFRLGRHRDRLALPIPSYETLVARSKLIDDAATRTEREQRVRAELSASLAPLLPKTRAARLIDAASAALDSGDYVRAVAAERLALEIDRRSAAAQVIGAVAWAGLHETQQAMNLVWVASKATGLRSPGMLWGAAWALVMAGQWAMAEPMLEELLAKQPAESTFAALLAFCQMRRGKLQQGVENARRAWAAAPRSPARVELLVDVLVKAGYLDEADRLLAELTDLVATDTTLSLAKIRVQMMRRDFVGADSATALLRGRGVGGDVFVTIGALCESARRDDVAAEHYRAALVLGFYPVAELGLARLALHRRDPAAARRHALAALDTTKTLGSSSVRAIELLPNALEVLLHAQEPAESIAWIVRRTENVAGPLTCREFLVYARDAAEAQHFVSALLGALQPAPEAPPVALSVNAASAERQPVGTVRPGIQSLLG